MRRRLRNFLPIVLIALMVQIFAPIGACWAAANADPLGAVPICSGGGSSSPGQDDQTGHRAHEGCCSACSVLQTGAPVDAPQASAFVTVERSPSRVRWLDLAPDRFHSRAGSHAQARAPPSIS